MQLFSANTAVFLSIYLFFAHENMKNQPQMLLIIGPIFCTANRMKSQFCSIKIAQSATYV